MLPGRTVADSFIRGDTNGNGSVDMTDAIENLRLQFFAELGHGVRCSDVVDVDDNGTLNLTDVVFALEYIFGTRRHLPQPSPNCGRDPTEDGLDCVDFGYCSVADGNFGVEIYRADRGGRSVALGDLDGDGRLDLVVANSRRDSVSVLINRNGRFAPSVNYSVGRNPRKVSIGDLNGDGRLDLVVGARGNPADTTGTIAILFNSGDGRFPRLNPVVPVSIRTWSSEIGDLDGDGAPDLVAVGGGERGFAVVFLNDGTGSLKAPRYFEADRAPYFLAIGDLSGDARPEIAIVNAMGSNVSVLKNIGEGRFGSIHDQENYDAYRVGLYPSSCALGDFDDDGLNDFAAVNGFPGELKIFLNRGNGRFDADPGLRNTYDINHNPTSIAVGDLDGDRDQDLVVTTASNDSITVFLNRGDGSFDGAAPQVVGDSPESVAIGDLDGDGDQDLVIANGKSEQITVLFNQQLHRRFEAQGDGAAALFEFEPRNQ